MEQSNSSSEITHQYNTRSKTNCQLEKPVNASSNSPQKQEFDRANYHELLAQLFPSNYMKQKAKATRAISKIPICNIKIAKSNILNGNKSKITYLLKNKKDKISKNGNVKDFDDEDDDDVDYNSGDAENEHLSDDSSEISEDDSSEISEDESSENDTSEDESSEDEKKSINKFRKLTENLKSKKNQDELIEHLVIIANDKKNNFSRKRKTPINKKISKAKEFDKLIALEDNLDDSKYFKKEMDQESQDKIINELKIINSKYKIDKPYRILVLEAEIPAEFKIVVLKKISMLESMDPTASEYFKLKGWIDSFMRLPFNKVSKFPISISDGIEKCSHYMTNAVETSR